MGILGFIVGTVAGQLCGSWVFWRVRDNNPRPETQEAFAAAAAGLVTAVIATAMYIPLGVHTWVGGIGTPWGMAAFLALSMGLCQAVLFRGRPLRSRAGPIPRSSIIVAFALILGLTLLVAFVPAIRALVFGVDSRLRSLSRTRKDALVNLIAPAAELPIATVRRDVQGSHRSSAP